MSNKKSSSRNQSKPRVASADSGKRSLQEVAGDVMKDVIEHTEARRARRAAAAAEAKRPAGYRNAVFTFIDILGYRQLVASKSATELRQITRAFYDVGSAEGDPADIEDPGLRVMAFSDSIVRIREASPTALFQELLSLVHMQAELAARGVLIRGALTHGEIFAEGTTVFGPALVRAYELESTNATYPRIIVDPLSLAFFDKGGFGESHNGYDLESGYVQEAVDYAEDGFWYVDYLRAFADELDEPGEYPKYLLDHAKCIATAAASAGSNLGVSAKINWLASYHNRVVGELDDEQLAKHGTNKKGLHAHSVAPFAFRTETPAAIRDDGYWARTSGPKMMTFGEGDDELA